LVIVGVGKRLEAALLLNRRTPVTLSTEDKLEILELCARYNFAFDSEDAEGWAETFTQDGSFGGIKGTEELRAFVLPRCQQGRAEGFVRCRHWNTSHVIEGQGDRARHRCYVFVIAWRAEGPPILDTLGTYEDALTKVDGDRNFVHREFTPDR
jgi:hypothetical protein